MKIGKATLGLAMVGAAALTGTVLSTAAFADYAPGPKDVVGVGSDTVQYASDFIADGDILGDSGYNALGNVNRIVNFDATPDANARLAYGSGGLGPNCGPGTGTKAGSGNDDLSNTSTPCVLNPTIVLRAGLPPVMRPNGSGAGGNALKADVNAGTHNIDYARASSAQNSGGLTTIDSIKLGTDDLNILVAQTTNAVALDASKLKLIYSANTGSCLKWNDPSIGGSSNTQIVPILPQVGSGTRSSFLKNINVGNTSVELTPGSCAINFEENDPTAIHQTGQSADAIEPMSSGRLNMFLGKLSDGTDNGVGGYFKDPSCAYLAGTAACPNTPTTLALSVKYNPGYTLSRNLYVYFRHADINSNVKWQPGGSLNYVRTLFYNPCSGTATDGGAIGAGTGFDIKHRCSDATHGPGGAPAYEAGTGQALISAAGIVPSFSYTPAGP